MLHGLGIEFSMERSDYFVGIDEVEPRELEVLSRDSKIIDFGAPHVDI